MSSNFSCSVVPVRYDRLRLTGKDRASWLHNFCTANVRALQPGESTEAFVLNGKGKTMGWILIQCHSDHLNLLIPSGELEKLHQHFDRYVIREDVQFHPVDRPIDDLFAFGSGVDDWLSKLSGGAFAAGSCRSVVLNGETVEVTATHFIGPGYLLSGESLSGEQSAAWLSGLGCRQGTFEQLEQHRLWHRCPTWGQDFNDDYLPQELRRDELAISFTKGCYLGQETVARIDALGHVNRLLTSVKLNGDTLPPVPSDILDNEKVVGQLTSVVRWDAQPGTLLGLATMKRNALQADRQFQCGQIPLTVVEHSA